MKNSKVSVMGVLRSTRVRSAFLVLLAAFILGIVKVIASSGNAPRPLSQKLPSGLRMATQTKQPDLLKELWAALGNSPYAIAECLARPALADRLARNWYAYNERFHGDLKAQAEGRLSQHRSPAQMRELGGAYRESEWALGESTKSKGPQSGSEVVSADEWNARGYKLAQVFAKANREPSPPGAQA